MGQYSWLIATRNNAERCMIDWQGMNTSKLFQSRVLQSSYEDKEQPKTLQEVAERFDNTKFMGYLNYAFISALIEFNKHLVSYGSFPRLYYEYEGTDEVWCLEFVPGTDVIHLLRYTFGHLLPTGDEYKYESDRRRVMASLPERSEWKSIRLQ